MEPLKVDPSTEHNMENYGDYYVCPNPECSSHSLADEKSGYNGAVLLPDYKYCPMCATPLEWSLVERHVEEKISQLNQLQ